MSNDRAEDRRAKRHKFRPELDGLRLESRVVLTFPPATHLTASLLKNSVLLDQYLLTHPQPGYALDAGKPGQYVGRYAFKPHGPTYAKGQVAARVIRGGTATEVVGPDGSHFRVSLQIADTQYGNGLTASTGSPGVNVIPSATIQPTGTVRSYPMAGGKVGLIVDGTTENMQLVIDPLPFRQRRGYAHSFAYGQTQRSHILNIGSLNVTSGLINAVLGFHSADLSGPLIIGGGGTIDRIAFNSLQPGAAIGVSGTVNTLDIANGITLNSGTGISIGRDLNLLNVGQDVNLSNGASLLIGRFAGLTPQPAKGTSTGSNFLSLNQSQIGTGTAQVIPSVSANIQGNLTLGAGSTLSIVSGISNSSIVGTTGGSPTPFVINGSLNLVSATQVVIPNLAAGTTFFSPNPSNPAQSVVNNLVARTGGFVNGVQIF